MEKTQQFIDVTEELCLQVDVGYIVRKLIFLDQAVQILLKEHQVVALCHRDKPTLAEAKKCRKMHLTPEMMKKDEEGEDQRGSQSNSQKKNGMVEQAISRKPRKNKESNVEDLSMMDLSSDGFEILDVKAAVNKVQDECLRGDPISQKIS